MAKRIYNNVRSVVRAPLYITGGHALAHHLHKEYRGDLDVICLSNITKVRLRLMAARIGYSNLNHKNCVRIYDSDYGYIDLICLPDRFFDRSSDITRHPLLRVLDGFTFTTNQIAYDIDMSRMISTKAFQRTYSAGEVEISQDAAVNYKSRSTLEQLSILTNWYGFKPSKTEKVARVIKNIKQFDEFQKSFTQEEKLLYYSRILNTYMPTKSRWALSRGMVFAILQNNVTIYDDIDVIIEEPLYKVLKFFRVMGIPFKENFFGNPKIKIVNHITVDVIPTGYFYSIEAFADKFAFNVEKNLFITEPRGSSHFLGMSYQKVEERLEYDLPEGVNEQSDAYYAIKATYFLARYDMHASEKIQRLIWSQRRFSNQNCINAYQLARELTLIHGNNSWCKRPIFEQASSESGAHLLWYYGKGRFGDDRKD